MSTTTPFLKKLLALVNELQTKYPHIGSWSPSGDCFIIRSRDFGEFLKKYFKGTQQTFIRQLHFYGFSKTELQDQSGVSWSFSHPKFVRDNPSALYEIQRKTKSKTDDDGPVSRSEVRALRNQIAQLQETINQLVGFVGMPYQLPSSRCDGDSCELPEESGENQVIKSRSTRKRKVSQYRDADEDFEDESSEEYRPESLKLKQLKSVDEKRVIGEHLTHHHSFPITTGSDYPVHDAIKRSTSAFGNVFDDGRLDQYVKIDGDQLSLGSISAEDLLNELEIGWQGNINNNFSLSPSPTPQTRSLHDSSVKEAELEKLTKAKFFTLDLTENLPSGVDMNLLKIVLLEVIKQKVEAKKVQKNSALQGMLRSLPDPKDLPHITDTQPFDSMELEVVPKVYEDHPEYSVIQIRHALRRCYENFYSKYVEMGKPVYSEPLCGGPCTF